MAYSLGRLGNCGIPQIIAAANSTGYSASLDGDTEKLALKYVPPKTSPITDVDFYVNVVGTTTGINMKFELQSDSGDAPSGTVLGATNNAMTAEFNHTASGWIGLKTLTENSGNLTMNTPIWLVLYRSSGNSLSASNYYRFQSKSITYTILNAVGIRGRHYNGTDWTTTALNAVGAFVVKFLDGTYDGAVIYSGNVAPAATAIYGTNRQGIKLKFGCQSYLRGFQAVFVKTGSPSSLVATVFEGATAKYTATVPASAIITSANHTFWFDTPVVLAADTAIYLVLKQDANGGDGSNLYNLRSDYLSSTYIDLALPPDMRHVYGTGDDPTAHTVSTTEFPELVPLIYDPASDFDQAAAGGRPEFRGANL